MRIGSVVGLFIGGVVASRLAGCSFGTSDETAKDSSSEDAAIEANIDGGKRPASGPITPPAGEIRFITTTKRGSLWAITSLVPGVKLIDRRYGVYEWSGISWLDRSLPQLVFTDAGRGARSIPGGIVGARDSEDIYIYGTRLKPDPEDYSSFSPILALWRNGEWTDLAPEAKANSGIGGFAETSPNRFVVGGGDEFGYPYLGFMTPPSRFTPYPVSDAGAGSVFGLSSQSDGEFVGVFSRASQPNNGWLRSSDLGASAILGAFSIQSAAGPSTERSARTVVASTNVNLVTYGEGSSRKTIAVPRSSGPEVLVTVGEKDITSLVPLRGGAFLATNSANELYTVNLGPGVTGFGNELIPVPKEAVPEGAFVAAGTAEDLWIAGATSIHRVVR